VCGSYGSGLLEMLIHEPSRRADPGLAALIGHATDGAGRYRPDRTAQTRLPLARRSPGITALTVLIGLLAALALRSALGGGKGVVADTRQFVHVKGTPSQGQFLMTAVIEPRMKLQAAAGTEAMDASQLAAVQAALACAGAHHPPGGLVLESRGFGGASAGLMFALTVLDELRGGHLAAGRLVAGTGTISPGGTVDPVEAIALKARAAADAGANVFFAPAAQVSDAQRAAPDLLVVGVDTLADAVRFLGGADCRS